MATAANASPAASPTSPDLNAQGPDAPTRPATFGNDAKQDIAKRLTTYGGQNIRLSSTSPIGDTGPEVETTTIAGQEKRGAHQEILSITRCGPL